MTTNFKTCDHIAAIYAHAARTVRNGSTLKSTREYMFHQLITRVEAGEVEGADVGHCSGAYSLQGVLRSKADFLAHCDREAAYWSNLASAHIQAQREAKKAKEATPRPFDLCHLAAAAVIAHRPGKSWVWQSHADSQSDASEDLLGWLHNGERKTARIECTHGQGAFRWCKLEDGNRGESGAWFTNVVSAVKDYFSQLKPTRYALERAFEEAQMPAERSERLEALRNFDASHYPAGTTARVATQCEDYAGRVGSFLFIPGDGKRVAISPVFASIADVFEWCKSYNWQGDINADVYTKGGESDFQVK